MTEQQIKQYLRTAQEAIDTPNVFTSTLFLAKNDLNEIKNDTAGQLKQEVDSMISKLNGKINE